MPYSVYHAGVVEVSSGFETRRDASDWIQESKQHAYYNGLRLGIRVGEQCDDGHTDEDFDIDCRVSTLLEDFDIDCRVSTLLGK